MNETLEQLCAALESLSDAVLATTTEQRVMTQAFGWSSPAITPYELANIPRCLAQQIRNTDVETIDDEMDSALKNILNNINLLHKDTIRLLFNSNHTVQATNAYMSTLQWIHILVQPLLFWQSTLDSKAMPAMQAKRLSSLRKQIEDISIDKDLINTKIKLINSAAETAEALPADLVSLKEARKTINELSKQASLDAAEISKLKDASDKQQSIIDAKIEEAKKLINQCEDAYRVTTSKGLAGSFEERANKLAVSMWVWVGGLLLALITGAIIGSERLSLLNQTLGTNDPKVGVIVIQSILSLLSLGAPLWFAWLSTKQIGQRFKLAEDYAYKSSVAKAYEGYRKEAARIDSAFESRLFNSALTRVEEAPLRLMKDENHGSPWHELLDSPVLQRAMDNIPELRDKILEITKDGITSVKEIDLLKKKSEKQAE